jgi:hypothetical protein
MNICRPDCAASRLTYFRHSAVRLFAPESTKHGRLFSEMTVRYVRKGKRLLFRFTWRNDPSF